MVKVRRRGNERSEGGLRGGTWAAMRALLGGCIAREPNGRSCRQHGPICAKWGPGGGDEKDAHVSMTRDQGASRVAGGGGRTCWGLILDLPPVGSRR